jgi:hypothetical protein
MHPHGWLVGVGQALGEGDPVLVFQTIGQDARQHVLGGLAGVLGDAQLEGLVHAAVHVGQLDRKVVERGAEGHAGGYLCRVNA